MEVKYTNFELDPKIYGQNEICALDIQGGSYLYDNIYDINDATYSGSMTVRFFLRFGANRFKKKFIEDTFAELEFSKDFERKKLKTLSSSELIKVLIIKLCVSDAKTIILDGVDAYLNYRDFSIILKAIRNNMGLISKNILILSQNLDNISMYVDRFIIVKDNKIVYNGSDFNSIDISTEIKEFIKKANKRGASLNNYKDPSDLLKAIYRSVK